MRKNRKNKGFTLVELITVLVILSIIAAIAVPFFINYWKKAEFVNGLIDRQKKAQYKREAKKLRKREASF